ncbi:MAG TPA: DUF5596 domain-containing protein [Clostridiaceae bacterium]|nr:DUF5596 domain-containing protein [Clostridiaceae bacterium]
MIAANNNDKNIKYDEFGDFICSLGIKNLPDIWGTMWDEAQKAYPGEQNMKFLTQEFISEVNKYLKLPEGAIDAFNIAVNIIKNNEALARLLWLNHYILFKDEIEGASNVLSDKKPVRFTFPDFSQPDADFSREGISFSGMFLAVLLISGLPRLLKFYGKHGIPERVILDTLSDIDIWMRDYYDKNKVWGLREFWWIYNHFSGRLFRIGRLQFIHARFTGDLKAFRNINTGKVISLSNAGIKFRTDGLVDGTNDIYDPEGGWVSDYWEDENTVRGNPISPLGYAENRTIELSKKEWKEVLSKGSPVLDVHIAAGSKLSHEACGESFKSSVEFFNKYFPEIEFCGFMCTSWLLDSQFQKILSWDTNIVKFQREFYLYPVKSNDVQTFERVFNSRPDDIENLKAETSLQKAILDYVRKGNKMHAGAMFLLKDDLKHWGSAIYQKD